MLIAAACCCICLRVHFCGAFCFYIFTFCTRHIPFGCSALPWHCRVRYSCQILYALCIFHTVLTGHICNICAVVALQANVFMTICINHWPCISVCVCVCLVRYFVVLNKKKMVACFVPPQCSRACERAC